MPVCFLCKRRNASFNWPKSDEDSERWRLALNLTTVPDQSARICDLHFHPNDMEGSSSSTRRLLRKGATPSANNPGGVTHDHTYSVMSRDAARTSVWLTLATVLMCWLPFLLLFFYCLVEDRDDQTQQNHHQHTRTKFVPVTDGNY